MGKKRQTIGDALREVVLAQHDQAAARGWPRTGDELRAEIDKLNMPYTRVAQWLGLSVDGLHKQMRGTRAVTPQTRLLFNRLAQDFEFQAQIVTSYTEDELQHADTPAYRSALRRKRMAAARKMD